MKEILELTEQEARAIIYGDNRDFKEIYNKIVDSSRWSIVREVVVQRISDGKFFASSYSEGATEYQDERPYEGEDPEFIEVSPVEKTVIVYE
jgi:hypothetical protein